MSIPDIPKSGFLATTVAVIGLTVICTVGLVHQPEIIAPHVPYILMAIGGVAGWYANGRLKRDLRENGRYHHD